MASFVLFPYSTAVATIGTTSAFPAAKIQPKPEPMEEDSLIAPPGIPVPLRLSTSPSLEIPSGMSTPSDMSTSLQSLTPHDMPIPLAIQFPQIEASDLPRESNSSTSIVVNDDVRNMVPVVENPANQVLFKDQVEHRPRSMELVRITNLSRDAQVYYRKIVRKTRMLYDAIRVYSTADEEKKNSCRFNGRCRGYLKAAMVMRRCGLYLYADKRIIGVLPGVEIGDMFSYRMEMSVVGLHGQSQAGIDFVPASRQTNWEPIATSIVVSGGYEGNNDQQNVIIYSGHGGQDKHFRQIAHQKMESGNLALERSMHYGIEVRVIRGHNHNGSPSGRVFVYDGLYRIIDYWIDLDMSGYRVYKYKLVRLPNQSKMGSEDLSLSQSLKIRPFIRIEGYACMDISGSRENIPIRLLNNIDFDHGPLEYQYLVKSKFPPFVYQFGNDHGCSCLSGCLNDCSCIIKNGGQCPYDDDKGILIQGKPLIFECGPFCSCPPNCRNRVTQKGVKHRLEVFRSRTGWGVRSLDYIQAGSFICEYAGVVLTMENAKLVAMGGDNLVYPRRFSERWKEWGDLSQVSYNYVSPVYPELPPLDFALDVSIKRNVASYIGHSIDPNVMIQFVIYDHNNLMFPRLMLFAMETIPPFREFSLNYSGMLDESSPKLAICN